MTTDLFTSKKEQLINFLRDEHYFSTSDVVEWGVKNFYLRAKRTVQDLVVEGAIRKIPYDECLLRGFKGKMGWYEYVGSIDK